MRYGGLNPVGLEKLGLTQACGSMLRTAYRLLSAQGKPALEAWLAEAKEAARKRGDAGQERLAVLVTDFLAHQTRSLLSRPVAGTAESAGDPD
jgi:hypothetical protein